jgi:hypothetical protein
MFEEDVAANVDSFDLTPPEEIEEQPTSPVEPSVEKEINSTKAYSERLNKDRERIRQEERDNIANSFGYDNWAEYLKAQTDSSLLEKGLDPEQIRPIIKDAIKNDPDYIEAMKIKQEKEQLEAKIWADDELKRLNEKFSLHIKSVDDLDEDVQNMWKSGISLEKAYAANHYEELRTAALKKSREISDGKSHLKDVNEGNNISAKTISNEQMKYFKALNPNATEDQIKAYINRK